MIKVFGGIYNFVFLTTNNISISAGTIGQVYTFTYKYAWR